ncbi:MAG: glycosyltransferase domain-containing protein [Candidatus Thorarchaeota archaeon]|jgi:hypothetical protein
MKDIVVYTACVGNRSTLHELEFESERCDFVAFCYPTITSNTWDVRHPLVDQRSYRRCARKYKILSTAVFPEYKYSIWIDASIKFVKDPAPLVDLLEKQPTSCIAGWKHPRRKCAYEELKTCLGNNEEMTQPKDDPKTIREQIMRMREGGFPENVWTGLMENGIMVRANCKVLKEIEDLWWEEVYNGTHEDQAVLPYALWKLTKLHVLAPWMPGKVTDNEYVQYVGHATNWI